jgi:hypothetical protein
MARREYGTDPYGIIAKGDPSYDAGSGFSVGRVGIPVQDLSSPGRTVGTGVGIRFGTSFGGDGGGGGGTSSVSDKLLAKTAVKKNAKGGPAKKSGCEVKSYGDMIKKAAGGKVQTSADTARKLAAEMGGMAVGGKPVKKAKGGAGKVRKGMMSPSGKMLQPVKPKSGLGSSY